MDETEQKAIKIIQLTRVLEGNFRIPFKGGRPEREVGKAGRIKSEDVADLLILLNTAKTFEEFLYNC